MPERIKRAHLARAKENFDNPETDTPGTFPEYFSGKYVEEYGKESQKQEGGPSTKVIKRYLSNLAGTREKDREERPGLLSKVQTEGKGSYPADAEEDKHLVHQIMKFIHSEEIQGNIAQLLKSSPDRLVSVIAETGSNLAAKLIFEIRKQREVTEEAESVILTIAIQELWMIARRMGMKNIDPDIVKNSIRVASKMYNQMEEQMKMAQQQPQQPVEQLEPQSQPGQQPPPQEGMV